MFWIIKFLYITIEVILQLNLSVFINESHIPEVQLSQVKTKLRDACEKY